ELADQRRNPRRSSRDHHDPLDPGLRQLADLLAQVMLIAALGRRDRVPFDLPRLALTGVPSKFIRRTACTLNSANSPSSITSARRVCSRIAGISEATKFSLSPS